MTRPRLLDLFCGAGGAAMGYHRAGFDVVGVDIRPQPRYPFEFVQADALTYPLDGYDAIHASPPCQAYSVTRHSHAKEHPKLIAEMRERLQAAGVPYVIENVEGAAAEMQANLMLCGAAFQLTARDDDGMKLVLKRHRLFETSFPIMAVCCQCKLYKAAGVRIGGVYVGGPSNRNKSWKRGGYTPKHHVRAALMGIDWMRQKELCESIPPAYSEYIGLWLQRSLAVTVP